MFPGNQGDQERRLDNLFGAYRDACVAPEASVNFMPILWQRIESRQKFSFSFRRMARGVVTAAIALTLAMTLYLAAPRSAVLSGFGTYVDVLAASHNSENSDLYETVRYDLGSSPDEL